MASEIQWYLQGNLISACSCDWGCPCNFDARPTKGWCQGTYVWHIEDGRFGDASLDGLYMSWTGEFPGPVHEGHGTAQWIADASATEQQREAIFALFKGGNGGPFAIFAAVTETLLEPIFEKFEANIDGLDSRLRAGEALEIRLTTIKNPVTGDPEDVQLVKPTGFTSQESLLGASTLYRFNGGFQHDHSGQYAEFAPFTYSGP